MELPVSIHPTSRPNRRRFTCVLPMSAPNGLPSRSSSTSSATVCSGAFEQVRTRRGPFSAARRSKLLVGPHFACQIGHVEVFPPPPDEPVSIQLIDCNHLVWAGSAPDDCRVGALLHHHPVAGQHIHDVALVVGSEA